MLQGRPQGIAQKSHPDVGLDPWLGVMEQGRMESSLAAREMTPLGLGQLHFDPGKPAITQWLPLCTNIDAHFIKP
jgi:hypothetical protein